MQNREPHNLCVVSSDSARTRTSEFGRGLTNVIGTHISYLHVSFDRLHLFRTDAYIDTMGAAYTIFGKQVQPHVVCWAIIYYRLIQSQ